MPVLIGAAAIVFQQDELTKRDIHWAMIFLCLIALALMAQAVGVIVISMFGAKLLHRVNVIADIVETKTGPILDRTNVILQDLAPKVKSVGENADHITSTARVQVKRADNIVSDALHATEEISHTVQHGIKVPLKQVAGVIAGVRAAVETLAARSPFGRR